ncbi:DUF421 domain-containing protein [Aliibacillus thermotolerans]|uniref:DUF421 domain-containing protein n=1 Tax=Aliibacillus thermotolerans TaxID=1834418 RepID=A0ABW0UAV3_9BACI|nr:DUF421 domain-containing protein [Aliibacillus thermotolerans]MDA3130820.1 DUF421 domain-containing protein [Aliibacillus thermotolerans]
MEFGTIIVRTVVVYFYLLMTLRLMGKREIGELSVLDFVVAIMFAEFAVISIEDLSKPLSVTFIPIFVLLIIQVLLAFLSLKFPRFREFIDGKPSFLIKNGKINEKEMKKQRYNFDDLLMQIRDKNIKDVADVEFAILEPTGELSVFPKKEKDRISSPFPLPLILDGEIQRDHLEEAGKDELWLRRELRKAGITNIKKVSYCTLQENGILFIDVKDDNL